MTIAKSHDLNVRKISTFVTSLITFTLLVASPIFSGQVVAMDLAGDSGDVTIGKKEYSPYLNRGYPLRVY